MLEPLKNVVSRHLKKQPFRAAMVVFQAQKFFDENFGQQAIQAIRFRSDKLTVLANRYLIAEFKRKKNLPLELAKNLGLKKITIDWQTKKENQD